MIEHECENCGHSWMAEAKISYCMACHTLDDTREDEEDGDS